MYYSIIIIIIIKKNKKIKLKKKRHKNIKTDIKTDFGNLCVCFFLKFKKVLGNFKTGQIF